MKKEYFNIIIIVLWIFANSQVSYGQYSVEWARGFGGDRSDEAKCVIETNDGNILFAGEVNRKQKHIWLLKTDFSGNKIWGRVYDNNFSSGAVSIIPTQDNNYIIVGYITRRKNDRNSDALIMKVDSRGRHIWRKSYGGPLDDKFTDIVETADGGFFVSGYTEEEIEGEKVFWIVKLDKKGEYISENGFSETQEDVSNSLIITSDSNVVVAGYGIYSGEKIMRIVKLNQDCEYIWDTKLENNVFSEIADLQELDNGDLIFVGTQKNDYIRDFDVFLLKYSSDGDSITSRKIGFTNYWEEATAITKTYDGDFLVSGFRRGDGALNSNFLVYKIDKDLKILWEHEFKKYSLDYAYSICELSDNGFVIAGSTYQLERGIDYASLKYKDLNKTMVNFVNPSANKMATEQNLLSVEVCISGYDVPAQVDVVVNGFLYSNTAFNNLTVATSKCKYPMYIEINLEEGQNEIEIFVVDKRGFSAYDKCEVYYVPPQQINW